MKKYYYLYQIRNIKNNMIYIGVHSTNKLRDRYMGSGREIGIAIRNEGRENFEKTIIKFFKTKKAMYDKERSIVNAKFISRPDTYNVILGGREYDLHGTVVVKDINGNNFRVNVNDSRYINGELKHVCKNKITVKNKKGKCFNIDKNDPRYLSGELISIHKGKVTVKDKDGKCFNVDKNDPRYLSGELIGATKGKILVKDEKGKKLMVDKNDPRYLSGELTDEIKRKRKYKRTRITRRRKQEHEQR